MIVRHSEIRFFPVLAEMEGLPGVGEDGEEVVEGVAAVIVFGGPEALAEVAAEAGGVVGAEDGGVEGGEGGVDGEGRGKEEVEGVGGCGCRGEEDQGEV